MKKLSVIVPAYNEEYRIVETLEDIHDTLSKQSFDYEILVVNDGSTDKTAKVVEALKGRIAKLILINNEVNNGKGWVTKQGMLAASGDMRLFMDADNSTKVAEVIKMLPYFKQGTDIVIGSRCAAGSHIAVKQSKIRIFLGWVLRTIIHILIPVGVLDSQCGFKVFTEKATNIVFPKQTIFRWAFDVDILIIARKNKLRIKEIPITWTNNTESHITFSGMVSMLLEIIKISFNFYINKLSSWFISLFKKTLSLFPTAFLIWVYNNLFGPKPLRLVANKMIQLVIPDTINIGNNTFLLNRKDVGVSGMLALGVYEKFELELFRSAIKPNMTVVDIGANIGLYSVIAGERVEQGRVFAYEPEEENFSLLLENIKRNNLDNVTTFKTALSDVCGTRPLYLTQDNRGTHSFVDNRNTGKSITVKTDTLDNSLLEINPPVASVDIIKMDVEGAEPLVFEGMKNIISKNPHVILFMEFYPKALERLGHPPVKFLKTLKSLGFSISVIDERAREITPVKNFEKFVSGFSKKDETAKNLYINRKTGV